MRLLLDVHIAEAVARALRDDGHDVVTLVGWREGRFRALPDADILREAALDERVLVTFDVHTMPAFAAACISEGAGHAGVLLVSERTSAQDDVGTLVRSLRRVLAAHGDADWHNRIDFLRRA